MSSASTRAKFLWKTTAGQDKTHAVGDCGEGLAAAVLDLKKSGEDSDFDLVTHDGRVAFEVKTRSTDHSGWRMRDAQVENHNETVDLGFPQTHVNWALCLLVYSNPKIRNRKTKKRKTALGLCRSRDKIQAFVRRNLQAVYVVDRRLVELLRKRARLGSLPCRNEELVVEIPGRDIAGVTNGRRNAVLRSWGLNNRGLVIDSKRVSVTSKDHLLPIEVEVGIILGKKLHKQWAPPMFP